MNDKYIGKYISLYGEDFLLEKLFGGKKDGWFVEVGCIDGLRFSNSAYFESIGWKGLCVEAHSDYIARIKENRPNSIVEHAAVGNIDADGVDFFANSRGTFSCLDETKDLEWKDNEYFTGFEIQKVKMLTLNTIFQKHDVKAIDFISIDIEGGEVDALIGIDFDMYQPEVILVESDSISHKKQVESVILKHGYTLVAALRHNLFYSLNSNHKAIIGHKRFKNVNVIHTAHPLDAGEDVSKVVDVLTR